MKSTLKLIPFERSFFAPRKMALCHAGWKARNYHTGYECKIRRSKLAATLDAFLEGPEFDVIEVKAISALSR